MITPFECIKKLAIEIQPIKHKYPMVFTYLKHLQKCDSQLQNKEVQLFKAWLIENPDIPKITAPYYKSSKPTICFSNVHALGNEIVIKNFETNLIELERLIFPDGKPLQSDIPSSDPPQLTGAAAAMATIENNPALSGLLADVKDIIADINVSGHTGIMENPKFKTLIQSIKKDFSSGKYKLADVSSAVHSVLGDVKDELDDNMATKMSEAVDMMIAAERGQIPDFNKIMDLFNFVSNNMSN